VKAAETVALYRHVRAWTERLAAPLSAEDQVVQSMPDASPVRWHRAHTTWFFETFVLAEQVPGFAPREPAYRVLFNSYYKGVGAAFPRARRGTLSRPGVAEIGAWRAEIDAAVERLMQSDPAPGVWAAIELGCHHEQQHQELLLTDFKHALGGHPMGPAYDRDLPAGTPAPPSGAWIPFEGGVVELGRAADDFCFDNETPRHKAFLAPYELAADLVTNGEYVAFLEDQACARPELWLSDGWDRVCAGELRAPLYWQRREGEWWSATLGGVRRLSPHAPVCHLSFFEAEAYARWAGARLPTEPEWEHAARRVGAQPDGTMMEDGAFHPVGAAAPAHGGLRHLLGEVWEWTSSAYLPYPGFAPLPGAVGEYNGKFMNDQRVLRGGSCATPRDHVRLTYRNFFQADKRWQFTGLRLARDL
jgi:ergothioneine biosynthesis protein EgtB